jgi:hypothetical protein
VTVDFLSFPATAILSFPGLAGIAESCEVLSCAGAVALTGITAAGASGSK